ncbi:MAG: RNA polymerase sigma factor [Rhodothermales bacterium]
MTSAEQRDIRSFERTGTLHIVEEHVQAAAIRNGDERAFRRLVEEHLDSVTRTVTGLLGNTQEVDDVVQEVFVKLHANMDTFRGDATLRTFITRIAINRSLDVLRARKRRRWLQAWGTSSDLESAGGSVEATDSVADAERNMALRRALNALPEKQRIVVLLRLVEELSTEETANVLGIKYGTVLSRLKRGTDALKIELSRVEKAAATEAL